MVVLNKLAKLAGPTASFLEMKSLDSIVEIIKFLKVIKEDVFLKYGIMKHYNAFSICIIGTFNNKGVFALDAKERKATQSNQNFTSSTTCKRF